MKLLYGSVLSQATMTGPNHFPAGWCSERERIPGYIRAMAASRPELWTRLKQVPNTSPDRNGYLHYLRQPQSLFRPPSSNNFQHRHLFPTQPRLASSPRPKTRLLHHLIYTSNDRCESLSCSGQHGRDSQIYLRCQGPLEVQIIDVKRRCRFPSSCSHGRWSEGNMESC